MGPKASLVREQPLTKRRSKSAASVAKPISTSFPLFSCPTLKLLALCLTLAAAYAIYDAGGIIASKDKMMALFERASASTLGGSNDWG